MYNYWGFVEIVDYVKGLNGGCNSNRELINNTKAASNQKKREGEKQDKNL